MSKSDVIYMSLNTLEEVFVHNLRRLRADRTQEEMAEAAGIPLRSYQRAEYGDIPQGPNRKAIAKALGVQETALFLDPDLLYPGSLEAAFDMVKNALSRRALDEFVGSSETGLSLPPDILEALSEKGPAKDRERLFQTIRDHLNRAGQQKKSTAK